MNHESNSIHCNHKNSVQLKLECIIEYLPQSFCYALAHDTQPTSLVSRTLFLPRPCASQVTINFAIVNSDPLLSLSQLNILEDIQPRMLHTATAFSLCPGHTQVTKFGGCPMWEKRKSTEDQPKIATTTVLEFGEYNACLQLVQTFHKLCLFPDPEQSQLSPCHLVMVTCPLLKSGCWWMWLRVASWDQITECE